MDLDGWAFFAPFVVAILAMVGIDLGVAWLMRFVTDADKTLE